MDAKVARQRTRAMSLAFLMVMMVQTAYLGTTDPWWSIEQDEVAPVSTSSAAAASLTPSVEGADLTVDVPMTNITFQYNASAVSGSSGGGSVTSSLAAQNMAGGRFHTCAIVDDGSVACWGDNAYGQLGDGTTSDRSTPTLTDSLGVGRTAVQVATGDYFTCVMLDNDEVKCWGDNAYGQLGDGTTTDKTSPPSSAITFPTGLTPVALVAGDHQACAIMDDESLTCWGRNQYGELGDGTTTNRNTPTAVSLNAGENVIDVGSGDSHTCALLDDGSIKCWGRNSYGQLGIGTTSSRSTPTLTDSLGTGRTAVDIGVSEFATCALLDNDDVKCWGQNNKGQLGDGTTTDKYSPPSSAITFPTGRTPVALSDSGAGLYRACALLDDGNVSCWGYNSNGQLGDGTTIDRNTPVLTDSLGTGRTAVHVTTGLDHACALLDNGDITCWGKNSDGQLGDGTTTDRSSPTAVSTSYSFDTSRVMGSGSGSGSGSSMTNVAGALSCTVSPALPTGLSINSSTCTISGTPTVETSNTTYTVTANISNVTYQGSVWLSTSPYATITSAVEGAALNLGEAMTPVTLNYTVNANASTGSTSSTSSFAYENNQIASGGLHTCAILDNGSVSCWGYGGYGQLGNGGASTKKTPTLTSSLGTGRTAVALSSGFYHTCAILDNGDVSCWGRGFHGQLGNGGTGNSDKTTPTLTSSLGTGRTAVALSSGSHHTCAILDNGSVSCWGYGHDGRLGHGGASTKNTPTLTSSLGTGRTAVALSSGSLHTCAILDNGDVSCWGDGTYGQLGNGGTTDKTTPTLTSSLGTGRTAVALSSGNHHTCAILDNGSVSCWGRGFPGQLGNGGTSDKTTPTLTSSLGTGRTAVALSSGNQYTCAILDNGSVSCWGRGFHGQLGNGASLTNSDKTTPTLTSSLGTGRTAVALSSGNQHTCAVLDNGAASCWGYGAYGLLGNGGSSDKNTPVSVSGSNMWDTTTTLVTWETHPALPAGMSISGGTISGTPSVYALNQTYTIYANQSGYSTTHELYFSVDTDNAHTVVENQSIDPIGFHPPFNNGTTCWSVSPALPGNLSIDSSTGEITGSVNGTLTNTTYTVTANHGCTGSGTGGGSGSGTTTYGNGSTWNALDLYGSQNGQVGNYMFLAVGDTIYFNGFDGVSPGTQSTMWAYDTSNGSAWQVAGINGSGFGPGYNGMSMVVGDTIYFSNSEYGTTGNELWAHNTSNGSSWRVADINSGSDSSNPGQQMAVLVGDTIYFSAECGSNCGSELWAHDTSNHSTWLAGDVAPGSHWGNPGAMMYHLIGDTLYFDGYTSSHGRELWAHDTSNHSTWQVADIWAGSAESYPGSGMSVVDGDILYFEAQDANGRSIFAHNTTNGSTWPVHTLSTTSSNPLSQSVIRKTVGDVYYTSFNDGSTGRELWAFGFTNQSMWQVADIRSGSAGSTPGLRNSIVVGDTLYFDANDGSTGVEFWAHDTSNGTTWQVADLQQTSTGSADSFPGAGMMVSIGDVIYFDAVATNSGGGSNGVELWAHNTSNHSSWLVSGNTFTGLYSGPKGPGILVGDTLYFPGSSDNSTSTLQREVYAHQPSEISPQSGGSGSGSGSGGSTGTGATETFTFNLQSLADYDGDGLPNDLPGDYDAAEGPTPGLVADTDDDADGLLDTVETDTGTYVDSSDTGTDPLNPDTDGDGVCDGPSALTGVCTAGPDTNNGMAIITTPLTLVNNSAVSEVAPFVTLSGATYAIAPSLPTSMQFGTTNGTMWGTPDVTMSNTTYTMWANDSTGVSVSWAFYLEVLSDLDGDGAPDDLPAGYDGTNDPIRTAPGLIADTDDDGDGLDDSVETDTGVYVDSTDTGTDPRNADSDGDGVCDGPSAVSGTCIAGPDTMPGQTVISTPIMLVNGTEVAGIDPFLNQSGATYAIAPSLPTSMQFGTTNGTMWGTPDVTMSNTTYTMWANHSSGLDVAWTFHLEVLSDLDGDGAPDDLPAGYDGTNDPIRTAPGLIADTDDDGDGLDDSVETDTGVYVDSTDTGTDPRNADSDGDGVCDGPSAVSGTCIAGPDTMPGQTVISTPIMLVNGTEVAGIDPFLNQSGATYAIAPSLPTSMQFGTTNGTMWGTPDVTMSNTTYTMWANHSSGLDVAWTFHLEVLSDLDGDGAPDDLPAGYDGTNDPIRTAPGLIADTDDDGDGLDDSVETDTGVYVDSTDTGTDPRNADSDGDGVCDGPSAVSGTCIAGPDTYPFGADALTAPFTLVNGSLVATITPQPSVTGATYAVEPPLPAGLALDAQLGTLNGTPRQASGLTSYTIWVNTSSASFSYVLDLMVLEDTDRDGHPDVLPTSYDGGTDPIRVTPGLLEDLDDDGDGLNDTVETGTGAYVDANDTGTDPLDPDTDGDGFCDGPASDLRDADGDLICRGPDPDPLDGTSPLDTDGDGFPDVDPDGPGGLVGDEDDDGDGYPDASELACGSNELDPTSLPNDLDGDTICDGADLDRDGDGIENANETNSTVWIDASAPGTSPDLADTDGDGVCDGPEAPMTGVCVAGPDAFPHDGELSVDTDGDRLPDELPVNYSGAFTEDLDDDGDGVPDLQEAGCSDPLNASSMPIDTDGDGLCDPLDGFDDRDSDQDGLANGEERGALNGSTDPESADTDDDGFCDGSIDVAGVCRAGPDPFPLDASMPVDTDDDGRPDSLPANYTGTLEEDFDDDGDGASDLEDAFPLDASASADTDGDGLPDSLVDGVPSTSTPALVVDDDDDDDGVLDALEEACGSNPLDNASLPADSDSDGTCDALETTETPDPRTALNLTVAMRTTSDPAVLEFDLEARNPEGWVGTISWTYRRDPAVVGTSWATIDGAQRISVLEDLPYEVAQETVTVSDLFEGRICIDVILTDTVSSGPMGDPICFEMVATGDHDGDGDPDTLPADYVGPLTEDLDDDDDGWSDLDEAACGSDSMDRFVVPEDRDGNRICDALEGEGIIVLSYPINELTGRVDRPIANLTPAAMDATVTSWEIAPDLPAGLTFDPINGTLSGTPTETFGPTNMTIWANNSISSETWWVMLSVEEAPGVIDTGVESDASGSFGFLPWWCCVLLLLLLLALGLLYQRRDEVRMLILAGGVGPEPENAISEPAFTGGLGTLAEPFKLRPSKNLKPGDTVTAKEVITISGIDPGYVVQASDLNAVTNEGRFVVLDASKDPAVPFDTLETPPTGEIRVRIQFRDDPPSPEGRDFEGHLRLGSASVHLLWEVDVRRDKAMMKRMEKERLEAEKKAKAEAEAKAKAEADKKAKAEAAAAAKAEAEAKKKAEAEAKAKAEADKKAKAEAAAAAKAEAEAKKKAEAEAKAKAEADKKAKAEAAAAAKAEAEAKKKAEAEAKAKAEADKKAKAEAAAATKAEAEAKKKAEADKKAKPVTKEAKKEAELERVKARAQSIDFKVLGTATASELKSEVKKGATSIEVADASEFADAGTASLMDKDGSTIITWTGKEGNALIGVSGITRVYGKAAVITSKDDLQVIKGIGPFIEEKLNALGITTYRQIANMTAALEEQVNEAIEFFPGRVKRDQWVAQAKILLGEDVTLDEKALKKAEDLERIAAKADGIDFGILGVATIGQKDDLQQIKGIGPFIEEKLNALGIMTFDQISKMTPEIEEEVNVAIEFFMGRVKRDEWVRQATELRES